MNAKQEQAIENVNELNKLAEELRQELVAYGTGEDNVSLKAADEKYKSIKDRLKKSRKLANQLKKEQNNDS